MRILFSLVIVFGLFFSFQLVKHFPSENHVVVYVAQADTIVRIAIPQKLYEDVKLYSDGGIPYCFEQGQFFKCKTHTTPYKIAKASYIYEKLWYRLFLMFTLAFTTVFALIFYNSFKYNNL